MIIIPQCMDNCFCEKVVPAYDKYARAFSTMSAR